MSSIFINSRKQHGDTAITSQWLNGELQSKAVGFATPPLVTS